jgi:hypothetical protein
MVVSLGTTHSRSVRGSLSLHSQNHLTINSRLDDAPQAELLGMLLRVSPYLLVWLMIKAKLEWNCFD